MSELITTDKPNLLVMFKTEGGLSPVLKKIKEKVDAFKPDMTTAAGRKEIASMARKVASSKTLLDSMGKDLVAAQKQEISLVDKERKASRDFLDALKLEVRKPLTDWENAEKVRIEEFNGKIQDLEFLLQLDSDDAMEHLERNLQETKDLVIDESWSEFQEKAMHLQVDVVNHFETQIAKKKKQIADAEELEALRKQKLEAERKEREAALVKEAEKRIAQEAEERAEREKKKVIKEMEQKLEREKKESDRIFEEQKKKYEYEKKQALREKQVAEAKEEQQRLLAEKKAKNVAHRRKVNRVIVQDLMTELEVSEPDAIKIVTAIATNKISFLKIPY